MKIAVFGQYYQNNTAEIVSKVVDFLTQNNVAIYFEASFLKIVQEKNIVTEEFPSYSNYDELDSDFDALISIGGDGTILKAATFIRDKNIPIIGINAGRLGFLATVQYENIETLLQKVLIKDYFISKRSLLSISTSPKYENFADLDFEIGRASCRERV